ncbi:MAG: methionyl-tRNA formyltransferase, partial [Alcaligenaceae bacterium]|nr:methionyl-tRNA formyltransferase [Alcaligenaceae bacterium]
LHDTLGLAGSGGVLEILARLLAGEALDAMPQPAKGVTYAEKLQKSEAALDFSLDAATLARRVRAFDPFPGATMHLPGIELPVKVWGALAVDAVQGAAPGTLVRATPEGIDIATADGVLRIVALQKAGGRRQTVAQFMQGWSAP